VWLRAMCHAGDHEAEDSAHKQAEAAVNGQVHREASEVHRENPLHELDEERPRGDEDPRSACHRSQ
jgi:hypothetical protein